VVDLGATLGGMRTTVAIAAGALLAGCCVGSPSETPEVACNRARITAHDAWTHAASAISEEALRGMTRRSDAQDVLDSAIAPLREEMRQRYLARVRADGPAEDDLLRMWLDAARDEVIAEQPNATELEALVDDVNEATMYLDAADLTRADALAAAEAALGSSAVTARDAAHPIAETSMIPPFDVMPSIVTAQAASRAEWEACRDVSP
jgi:hypothetical protein